MKVIIKEKEVQLKKTMRSYIMFENINDGKMFAPKSLTDMVTFFYCVVCSSDRTLDVKFDEFLDWIDENEGILDKFATWLNTSDEVEIPGKKKTKAREKKKESQ